MLVGSFMVNRTISLDQVSDELRKKLVKGGTNFSYWVRNQLIQNAAKRQEPSEAPLKPKPHKNYLCRNCMMAGHWTADCPHLEGSE